MFFLSNMLRLEPDRVTQDVVFTANKTLNSCQVGDLCHNWERRLVVNAGKLQKNKLSKCFDVE